MAWGSNSSSSKGRKPASFSDATAAPAPYYPSTAPEPRARAQSAAPLSSPGSGYQPQQQNPYAQGFGGAAATNPYANHSKSVGSVSAANLARHPGSAPGPAQYQHHNHHHQHQQPQQSYPQFSQKNAGGAVDSSYSFDGPGPARTFSPTPPPPPGTGDLAHDGGRPSWMSSRSNSATSLPSHPADRAATPPDAQMQPPPGTAAATGSGFFSRFRSSLSNATSVFGRDCDGDTEDDTLIAGALVRYYVERDGGAIPPWLASARAARTYNGRASVASQGAGGAPGQHHYSGAGASQLQEIYRKQSVVEQQHYGSSSSLPGPHAGNGGSRNGSGSAPGAAQHAQNGGTSSANRFKDKLKTARPSLEVGPPSQHGGSNNGGSAAGAQSWRTKPTYMR